MPKNINLIPRKYVAWSIAVGFILTALCGCVGDYKVNSNNRNEITEAGLATIQFSRVASRSFPHMDWTSFVVEKVYGPAIKQEPPIAFTRYLLPLAPGQNTLEIRVNDFRSVLGGNVQRVARGELSFYAAPGISYILNGSISGDLALVWISERDTMRHVTNEVPFVLGQEIKTETGVPVIVP